MARIAQLNVGGLATGKLVNIQDGVEFNCVAKNIDFIGILLTGTFGATGKVALLGGVNLSFINPATMKTDPEDGTHSAVVFDEPGLYMVESYQDTIALGLGLGTNGVTDIDVVIFTAGRLFYSLNSAIGVVQ
jgi:hypothetical protein